MTKKKTFLRNSSTTTILNGEVFENEKLFLLDRYYFNLKG